MSFIAERLSAIQPSPTVAITAKAKEMRAEGRDIIALSVGEPDFPTPAAIAEAGVEAIRQGYTKYTNVDGMPELKAAIREKFRKDNELDYGLDQITVSSGAKIILFNALLATVNPGDEVIIPAPYWVSYPDMVRLVGGEPVIVPCAQERGFLLDAATLEAAITPRTRMLILNTPNNPTGSVYDEAAYEAIAGVLEKHPGVLVLTDELYEHLTYDGFRFRSLAAVAPALKERVITVNGMSKGYAMTGWRLGFAGGPREIIRAINVLQSQNVNAASTIAQYAALQALTGPRAYLEDHRKLFQKRRDLAVSMLNQTRGVSCDTPVGAFYVYPGIADCIGKFTPEGKRLDSDTEFVLALLETEGVAAVPGSAFGLSPFFRISYALSLAEMEEALGRIQRFCASLR